MYNKGSAYYHIKEYYKAIDCYDQVLLIDPKDTDALYSKGSIHKNLK